MPLDPPVGAVVELVCLLLGGFVLLRLAATTAAGLVARAARAGTGAAVRAGRAVRPGLARRLAASVVGLGSTAAALAAPTSAVAAPVRPHGSEPALIGAGPISSPTSGATVTTPAPAYVVRAGDTLWDIARRHLPPGASAAQVARAWPRWYAANRGVIGPDPSLIVPGQHLRVPGRRSAGTPTQPHAAPAPTTGTPVPSALSLDPDRR